MMRKIVSVAWSVVAVCASAIDLPALPTLPADTVEASAFGIKGDGSTDNTAALQSALDAVAAKGGVLRIKAAAKAYLTGPLVMKSKVELRLDAGATVKMLPLGKYPAKADGSYAPLLTVDRATDISLTGRGTIDGDGDPWWTGFDAGTLSKRPPMLAFTRVQRVLLKDIHLQNAPNVHMSFHYEVADVTVRGISITAPESSPNTDGCDLEGRRFLFERDTIQVGDDNIAIQPGHDSTSDVTIQDCLLGVGHGLSIGSWCNYGVRNLLAQRIVFKGTTSGIRMKAGRDRGGMVRDLVYKAITMTDVQYPLYITSYYPSSPATTATDTLAPVTATTPRWKNISVQNLTSTSTAKGCNSVVIYALPEAPMDSLTLTNVHFSSANAFSIQHSHGMFFSDATWGGSSTTLFGTSRDVTYRKTSGISSFNPAMGGASPLQGRILTNRSANVWRVRVRGLDGSSASESWRLGPGGRMRIEGNARSRIVEVDSGSGPIAAYQLSPFR